MKKSLLLALIPLMFATGCADEPKEELPPASENSYTAKLTADNSTLVAGADDTTEPIQVEVASNEDANIKYTFEIDPPCYLSTKSSVANQICVKPGAAIRSVSTYQVEKITVDFWNGKGTNYQVFNNVEHTGDALEYHESSIAPMDPNDSGKVYEYAIDANGWSLYNNTTYKPTFYYITVTFKK